MLKNNNDLYLINKGINEEVIPFYQIWQELTYEKTLDTYQYRILTSLSALEELSLVINKTLTGLITNDANINTCREETLYLLNNDIVLNKHYKGIVDRLRYYIGSKPKDSEEKRRLLAHVNYAIKEIYPTYERRNLIELKESILTRDMKRMETLSNTVASQAAHNGWSSRALTELLRFFQRDNNFDEQWSMFETTLLNHDKKSFDVLIFIPFKSQKNGIGKNVGEILTDIGLDICSHDNLINEYRYIENVDSLLNAQKKYFKVNVDAFDIYSAAHNAIRKVSDLLNMASFYNLVSAWSLSAVTVVVIDRERKYYKQMNAGQLYKTHDYLEGSGKVYNNTKQIFADESKRELREKLTGSFGYANISRASLFQEEKYMNLWVALESLARTKMYPDIISNIIQTVPAAMSLKYIYRIVRNYVEDCNRCEVYFEFGDYYVDMKQETKQQLVRQTINIFASQELYIQLLDKCRVNTLLRYRTEVIYELLSDISKIRERIKIHHDRVKWQIQRLYRIRNEIAHAALQNETSLVKYIEHLYDYLATYIAEIVSCVCDMNDRTIEESIAVIKDNYDVFNAFVDHKDTDILENTVLKTGIINLVSEENEY